MQLNKNRGVVGMAEQDEQHTDISNEPEVLGSYVEEPASEETVWEETVREEFTPEEQELGGLPEGYLKPTLRIFMDNIVYIYLTLLVPVIIQLVSAQLSSINFNSIYDTSAGYSYGVTLFFAALIYWVTTVISVLVTRGILVKIERPEIEFKDSPLFKTPFSSWLNIILINVGLTIVVSLVAWLFMTVFAGSFLSLLYNGVAGDSMLMVYLVIFLVALLFLLLFYIPINYILALNPDIGLMGLLRHNFKILGKNLFSILGYYIVIILLNIAGIILLGFGVIFTGPLSVIYMTKRMGILLHKEGLSYQEV